MNEQTNQLIEKLAQKLGTTTEYLWGVLIQQAKIDAITTLFQFGLIALFGYILYRLNKKFRVECENGYDTYYLSDSTGWIMGICFGVWCLLTFIAFFCIPDVINGLINPEYWALDKVLTTIK